jgi:phage host-nuclease inhibitor protein Gam
MAGHELIRAPDAHPATAAAIKAQIGKWQAEIARLEALMADHQAQFRATQEGERAEALMAELLRLTADLMSAREAAGRLEGELTALRAMRSSRPWWWRMLTSRMSG